MWVGHVQARLRLLLQNNCCGQCGSGQVITHDKICGTRSPSHLYTIIFDTAGSQEDTFSDDVPISLGVDFYIKNIVLKGKNIRVQVWDSGEVLSCSHKKLTNYCLLHTLPLAPTQLVRRGSGLYLKKRHLKRIGKESDEK